MKKNTKKVAAKKVAKVMRKCAVCGKAFSPKSVNAVTCSEKCYKVRKATLDKKRKAAKKVAAKKPTLKEKIVLPKKPTKVVKPTAKKQNPDTIISVKNGNPFKVFVLATIIRDRAMKEIVRAGKLFVK